ncbi:hypothetical protein GGF46_003038, partial [Coemansia sp. RSA 552]
MNVNVPPTTGFSRADSVLGYARLSDNSGSGSSSDENQAILADGCSGYDSTDDDD